VYVCCISQGSIKTPFKGDWWFWYRFVPSLLLYMYTSNYSSIERFDKVILKMKWCSFFASQHILCGCAGRDFGSSDPVDVPTQVSLLVKQATSHESLCQCYIGWYVLQFSLSSSGLFTAFCWLLYYQPAQSDVGLSITVHWLIDWMLLFRFSCKRLTSCLFLRAFSIVCHLHFYFFSVNFVTLYFLYCNVILCNFVI